MKRAEIDSCNNGFRVKFTDPTATPLTSWWEVFVTEISLLQRLQTFFT